MLIAAVPALIFAVVYRRQWNRRVVIRSIILGTAFFGALSTQNIGMVTVTASKAGFLTTTYVAFVPVIAIVVLKRKVKSNQIIAAIICMVGAALLSYSETMKIEKGELLVLTCGLLYAVHIIVADCFIEENGMLLHIGQILTAAVLSTICAAIFEPMPQNIGFHCTMGLLYCGLLEVFLCFFLQIVGQKNTPVSLSSILLSMESVYSAIFAFIFLKERMSLVMIFGCILIFSAAVISERD